MVKSKTSPATPSIGPPKRSVTRSAASRARLRRYRRSIRIPWKRPGKRWPAGRSVSRCGIRSRDTRHRDNQEGEGRGAADEEDWRPGPARRARRRRSV